MNCFYLYNFYEMNVKKVRMSVIRKSNERRQGAFGKCSWARSAHGQSMCRVRFRCNGVGSASAARVGYVCAPWQNARVEGVRACVCVRACVHVCVDVDVCASLRAAACVHPFLQSSRWNLL